MSIDFIYKDGKIYESGQILMKSPFRIRTPIKDDPPASQNRSEQRFAILKHEGCSSFLEARPSIHITDVFTKLVPFVQKIRRGPNKSND